MPTSGELGVLDLDFELGEEDVLCRVLAQVTEEDLEGGREDGGWRRPSPAEAAPPNPRSPGCRLLTQVPTAALRSSMGRLPCPYLPLSFNLFFYSFEFSQEPCGEDYSYFKWLPHLLHCTCLPERRKACAN